MLKHKEKRIEKFAPKIYIGSISTARSLCPVPTSLWDFSIMSILLQQASPSSYTLSLNLELLLSLQLRHISQWYLPHLYTLQD